MLVIELFEAFPAGKAFDKHLESTIKKRLQKTSFYGPWKKWARPDVPPKTFTNVLIKVEDVAAAFVSRDKDGAYKNLAVSFVISVEAGAQASGQEIPGGRSSERVTWSMGNMGGRAIVTYAWTIDNKKLSTFNALKVQQKTINIVGPEEARRIRDNGEDVEGSRFQMYTKNDASIFTASLIQAIETISEPKFVGNPLDKLVDADAELNPKLAARKDKVSASLKKSHDDKVAEVRRKNENPIEAAIESQAKNMVRGDLEKNEELRKLFSDKFKGFVLIDKERTRLL